MLTGRLPFVSTNAMELVRMHRDDQPPAVADVRADAPPRLESITTAALAKDPADRPADGAALLRELRGDGGRRDDRRRAGRIPAAGGDRRDPGAAPAAAARARRRLPVVPLIVALVVLLGGGVALALALTRRWRRQRLVDQSHAAVAEPAVGSVRDDPGDDDRGDDGRDLDRGDDDRADDDRPHDHGPPPTTTAPVDDRCP